MDRENSLNSDLLASLKELEKYMTECGYFGGKNPQYAMAMRARTAIQKAGARHSDIIQECINAITAEGVRVREGSNDSWRGGMFYAAETLRKMKFEKEGAFRMLISDPSNLKEALRLAYAEIEHLRVIEAALIRLLRDNDQDAIDKAHAALGNH
jgi:hypothetical protein